MPQMPTLDVVEAIRPDITGEVKKRARRGHSPAKIAQYLITTGVLVSDDVVRRWLWKRDL